MRKQKEGVGGGRVGDVDAELDVVRDSDRIAAWKLAVFGFSGAKSALRTRQRVERLFLTNHHILRLCPSLELNFFA